MWQYSNFPNDRTIEALIVNGNDICIRFIRYVSPAENASLNNSTDTDWLGYWSTLGADGYVKDEVLVHHIKAWREMTL